MVELAFDTFVNYSFPTLASSMVQAVESLGAEQDPPFSHGNYFIECRNRFLEFSWVYRTFYNDMCEPIFAMAIRCDFIYADANFSTFSSRRINDSFRTVSENIAFKWPGYILSKSGHIFNNTDHLLHMDDLLALMRSKDIDRYEREKDYFFSRNARYTTGNSRE